MSFRKKSRKPRNPQGPKPLVWRGYRNCARCTRWRPVSDFTVYLTRTGYEQIKSECAACKRERGRESYGSLTPEEKRIKGIEANRRTQMRRQRALAQIERQRKNLDKQNEKLEQQWDKIMLGRKWTRPPRGTVNGSAVDITPFRMWLMRQYREHDYNVGLLADDVGKDASQVRRWLDGYTWMGPGLDPVPVRAIDVALVDEIGTTIGDPGLLERLYPFEKVEA